LQPEGEQIKNHFATSIIKFVHKAEAYLKVKEIIAVLESFAPPSLQESYDNAGLITGNPEMEVSGALLCLDSTEAVIAEAIATGYNLIIAHHPIVFSGLKKITGKTYVERVIISAIKNNIAIYAAHTNLDNVGWGVNAKIASRLNLKNCRVLSPLRGKLMKLFTFAPQDHAERVRQAIFDAGGGAIGNYDECSFNSDGYGTFRGNSGTNPYVGKPGTQHREIETKIEIIFPSFLAGKVVQALKKNHPYEEVAFDLIALENSWHSAGAGVVGDLEIPLEVKSFFDILKKNMRVAMIRHTSIPEGKLITRVAACGGAGSFLLNNAIASGADIFITADFKYHQFFDAEDKIIIADIGHYESEQFTTEIFAEVLRENFPNFAVRFTSVNTNPINYT
jgi:dinuclear metal center YbgI/SA1388 family protein